MSGRDLDPRQMLAAEPSTDEALPIAPHTLAAENPALAALGHPLPGVIFGELLAIVDNGTTALIRHRFHPGAVRAHSVVDLHGTHIGCRVVLAFEQGDPLQPVVMGVLRSADQAPLEPLTGRVEVDVDGERMLIGARNQLVLRCGKASITLTKAGKVLIDGSYVLSRSTGVNRIKGGSVQVN